MKKTADYDIFPHFLGIGAPRSGSTWLHVVLSQHPDIYMPPIKEVHYFDSVDPTINEIFHVDSMAYRYKWLLPNRLKHYAGYALGSFNQKARIKAKPDLNWDSAFFKPGGDIEWYKNLFGKAAQQGKITGEITPAYIMLGQDTIKTIRSQTGVRKIIVLLRNPIDATWSCVEKQVRDLGPESKSDYQQHVILDRIRSQRLFARYRYADNLDNWLKYYQKDEIFLAFFEELQQDPVSLLSRVFSFLDVRDMSQEIGKNLKSPVNAARGSLGLIPLDAKLELAGMHIKQAERLAAYLGGYATDWHKEMKDILETGQSHHAPAIHHP